MKVTSESVPQQFKPFTIKIEIENETDLAYLLLLSNTPPNIVKRQRFDKVPDLLDTNSVGVILFRQLREIVMDKTNWIS
jgi:hypothetical protein